MSPPIAPEPATMPDQTRWFTEAVQPHESALRRYLRSKFPSIETDDVVQESYFRLLRARMRGNSAFSKAYIFAIARNTALTLFHRRRIYASTPLAELPDANVVAEKSDASDHLDNRLRFQLAIDAINTLPPRCREIFRLAVVEQLSPAEIVRRTGLTETTVYTQLTIGLRKCSAFLRERGERP
jgi:RNA polymerase sigma factor (sigma-70 family)